MKIDVKFLFVFCSLLTLSQLAFAQTQKIRVNQTEHPLDAYAVGALRVALANMPGNYEVVVGRRPITQTRAIEELQKNDMDLMWLASNAEAEDLLLPIRFPLLKGLLGHRICIINPDNQYKFSKVETLEDLRKLKMGQGQGWPDVDILRANGLQVVTTSKYQNLFYMVEGGRFDGFPRGANEPFAELAAHSELDLTVDTDIVLVYRLPFYLFVRPEDTALAAAIHQGFETALANGQFDEYFYSDPMVKDALEKSNMKRRRAFALINPNLHPKTPVDREDYWLDLKAL